jgi:hypothetical protein
VVGGRDGAGGRRQCQEGVVDGISCEVALHVYRGSWSRYPIGGRLGRVQSAVQSGYGAEEGCGGLGASDRSPRSMSQAGL